MKRTRSTLTAPAALAGLALALPAAARDLSDRTVGVGIEAALPAPLGEPDLPKGLPAPPLLSARFPLGPELSVALLGGLAVVREAGKQRSDLVFGSSAGVKAYHVWISQEHANLYGHLGAVATVGSFTPRLTYGAGAGIELFPPSIEDLGLGLEFGLGGHTGGAYIGTTGHLLATAHWWF